MTDTHPGDPDRTRAALRQIISDYGPEVLSSPATLSSVLNDALPDDPRLRRMLIAAAENEVADALRQRISEGVATDVALTSVTSDFAAATMFTPEASAHVVGEFAAALGLTAGPESEPSGAFLPPTPEAAVNTQDRPAAEASGRPLWKRRHVFIPAGAVVAVGAVAAILLAAGVIGGPSYPHSWCGPVLTQLRQRRGTQDALESGLRRTRRQDHAPVGTLLNDLYSYDVARAIVQNGSNMNIMSDLANESAALQVVASDLRAINRECGQPPNAYKSDDI